MGREKPVRVQARANLSFPPSRVKKFLRRILKGTRLSEKLAITAASFMETSMNAFMADAKLQMSEKERESGRLRARHCAAALANTTSQYHGIFPTKVAGIYIK